MINRQAQQASQQTIVQLLEKLSLTQKQLELPPVAASVEDLPPTDTAPALPDSADQAPDEPSPGGTKTGAIVLGVLGALWLSYLGYLSHVPE